MQFDKMAERLVSTSTSQCSALANFMKEFQALEVKPYHLMKKKPIEDEQECQKQDHLRKETNSQMLWPFYNHLVEKWEVFVRDLLKETVEVVYTKLSDSDSADTNPHLQEIVSCALLHHSSNETIHQLGAMEMSRHILPRPDLWKDIVDSYKKHLLDKCDEVHPIFDGGNGIDKMFKMIFGTNTCSLSQAVVPIEHKFYYHFGGSKSEKTTFSLPSVEILSALLHYYYGAHCISTGKNSEYFSELDIEPFSLPIKPRFQACFGKIPGDFLHYFFKIIDDYKAKAYLDFNMLRSAREFFHVLAHALCEAVSKFIKEHFDIDF